MYFGERFSNTYFSVQYLCVSLMCILSINKEEVVHHYITKRTKNDHFRASYRKKLLQRPSLISDFTYISLSVSAKIGHFYLKKLKTRPISPLISTYHQYINFGRGVRLFFTNNGALIFGGSTWVGTRCFVLDVAVDISIKPKKWTTLVCMYRAS